MDPVYIYPLALDFNRSHLPLYLRLKVEKTLYMQMFSAPSIMLSKHPSFDIVSSWSPSIQISNIARGLYMEKRERRERRDRQQKKV
jgi:hypothetical protein